VLVYYTNIIRISRSTKHKNCHTSSKGKIRVEGRITVKRIQGIRSKQISNDLKNERMLENKTENAGSQAGELALEVVWSSCKTGYGMIMIQ
jgi:hypothetical protein